MEDCSMLISDCIVVSCCCECIILQLIIFILVQLPRKLARKTKQFAKRKLAHRRRRKGEKNAGHDQPKNGFIGFDTGRSMSMRILELEGIAVSKLHQWGNCSDEVDKVLEDLSMKGEFAFGSFWGKKHQQNGGFCCKCSRSMSKEEVLEFGSHVVQFHFMEVVGAAPQLTNIIKLST